MSHCQYKVHAFSDIQPSVAIDLDNLFGVDHRLDLLRKTLSRTPNRVRFVLLLTCVEDGGTSGENNDLGICSVLRTFENKTVHPQALCGR